MWPLISSILLYAAAFIVALFVVYCISTNPAKAQEIVYPNYSNTINLRLQVLALAGAENWDGHAIGAARERGRLQFKASTWYQFSCKPHTWAERRTEEAIVECDRVETTYILELMTELRIMGRIPTPYLVALMHNAGGPVVASGRWPADKKDFASRAANIYEYMTGLAAK